MRGEFGTRAVRQETAVTTVGADPDHSQSCELTPRSGFRAADQQNWASKLSMNTPLRLLLVDDHSIVREGLRALLDDEESLQLLHLRGVSH